MTSDDRTAEGQKPRPFAGPGHTSTWHCWGRDKRRGSTLGAKGRAGLQRRCAECVRTKEAQA